VRRRLVGDPEGSVADRQLGDDALAFGRPADAIDLLGAERFLVELDGLAAAPDRELRRDDRPRRSAARLARDG
jgi:hypothetical protein